MGQHQQALGSRLRPPATGHPSVSLLLARVLLIPILLVILIPPPPPTPPPPRPSPLGGGKA